MKTTVGKNVYYGGEHLSQIACPLGGLGAGMFCMEGTGALSQFSLRHEPYIPGEPNVFAALAVKQDGSVMARVLEGAVPRRKIWDSPNVSPYNGKGNGLPGRNYGLPRFSECRFHARFPFAHIELSDETLPLTVNITGWSSFIPSDDLHSGLPCATLEYTFANISDKPLECVYYFAAFNFLNLNNGLGNVSPSPQGFTLSQTAAADKPWEEAHLRVSCESADTHTDTAWFRGGWYDTFTMVWNTIKKAEYRNASYPEADATAPGGNLAIPFTLTPGESVTIRLNFCWYAPTSKLREGAEMGALDDESNVTSQKETYAPWYTTKFSDVENISAYYTTHVKDLRAKTLQFTDMLFDTNMPSTMLDAVNANLFILKSPTILRQRDGRLWCWEGCCETVGSCAGTCTHVWNYAQAICHLFPALERSLRQTEFNENQNERGHQSFRASLPIRPTNHDFHAAADGQLGGIMKTYRDWRVSGDTQWMVSIWPKVKQSLEYCINTWDPDSEGVIRQPHHNTYDIEFYGVEPMCTSVYLGALKAAAVMAREIGETDLAGHYDALREKGARYAARLYNGEYLQQELDNTDINASNIPVPAIGGALSPEAVKLIQAEGPKYQYGTGCLSDGVIGAWMASLYGLGDVMDTSHVSAHLKSVFKYNYKTDLANHENTQRPGYAWGTDGGLLLCTWPRGGKLSLPFVYSDEVWTGIEYQVASHLLLEGFAAEAEQIVKTCRDRYDGTDRNPFDEYECGHWYARALASFSLLQAYSGVRYDKVTRTLFIKPAVSGDAYALLSFDGGYGMAGVKDGQPFYKPVAGEMLIEHMDYTPFK
jgi:uncharacterized protein (DUF608 family)